MTTHRKLYQVDSNDGIRVWWMEQDGHKYRTNAGVENGKIVVSGWKYAEGKNVGRSNETTPEQQALREIESTYADKLKIKYYETRDQALAEGHGKKFEEPMLASKWKDHQNKLAKGGRSAKGLPTFPFMSQPKLDGYRCLKSFDRGLSRGGETWHTIGHIHRALSELYDANPGLILDGELYNHEYREDFNKLGSLIKRDHISPEQLVEIEAKVQYHVYDVQSMKTEPFHERLQWLYDNIPHCHEVQIVGTTLCRNQEELDDCYGKYLDELYEGQMVRDPMSLYQSGDRPWSLMKRKEFFDEEYPIIRVEPGTGNWAGRAKRVIFKLPNGGESKAGIKGTYAYTEELLKYWQQYEFTTIRFPNKTPNVDKPRFGVAVAFHKKKRND